MTTLQYLNEEIATYEKHKAELVAKSAGKFVLIHGDQVASVWDTYEDALKAGYNAYKLEPFLVKRIQAIETVQRFSRDLT